MRRLSITLLIILVAAGGGYVWWRSQPHPPVVPQYLAKKIVVIDGSVVQAEVATTETEHAKGLSGRLLLAPDAGMLFVFPKADRYGFWMKDMRIPLDFIYLRDGAVVALKENVPVPIIEAIPFYPDTTFDAVLEVNAGWIRLHQTSAGVSADY